ncbi:MAG TPA: FAD-dependent oxidoreductase [Acidimicrobiia bacterium]|nr:FAD-dependent oxidoreductase [Acidimicrobiia bacterium]
MEHGTTVWRDTAGAGVLAALEPGVPSDLDRRPDVLVVGGGVIGLATAALCMRAGLGRVVLIERERLAAGASGSAAALLTPEAHVWTDPQAFVALARASLQLLRALDDEWDGAIGVETLDWLVALPQALPLDAELGAQVDVLDPDGAHAVEPELGDVPGALRIREQSRVHPLRLAVALAARTGAVATGIEMRGVTAAGGRVIAVSTSHGDLHPGAVVFATGVAPKLPELAVPQRWVKGHLLATVPAPFRLRTAVAALEGLVLQLAGGEIVAGGTLDEGDDDPAVRDDVIAGIRNACGPAAAHHRPRGRARLVLLPPHHSRRTARHRPRPGHRERVGHRWALPYRHPHGGGDGRRARTLGRDRSPPGGRGAIRARALRRLKAVPGVTLTVRARRVHIPAACM